MATKFGKVANICTKNKSPLLGVLNSTNLGHKVRCIAQNCTTIPGPIPAEPLKKKFSIPKVLLCVSAGVYVGQYAAKTFAAFLEETEMFVPDDDDD